MGRNYGRSNNWSSQDGINQKQHFEMIKSRARSKYKSKRTIDSKILDTTLNPSPLPPTSSTALDDNAPNNPNGSDNLSGLIITGIVIGSLIVIILIIYCIIRFIKKRKKSLESQEDQEDEDLPHPQLTINFVKHNHPIPELCTTPDTQPILDYYSSKAGLTDASSPHIINSNKLNLSNKEEDNNNKDHKSTPVEVKEDTKKPTEENEYVPQYYNGMEIPPLGARIIPLERQVQIAKELTSVNLSPTKHKRKSNRSISSILSISSRRKSSTSNTISNYHNNNYYNNNNSSTTNSLTQISETPRNDNAANIV
uniref:Uncharacterized protein n=1 Tax=Anthurium amnicola TaxID=1678845 RepID=A0A1D1ZKM4_9ARAE